MYKKDRTIIRYILDLHRTNYNKIIIEKSDFCFTFKVESNTILDFVIINGKKTLLSRFYNSEKVSEYISNVLINKYSKEIINNREFCIKELQKIEERRLNYIFRKIYNYNPEYYYELILNLEGEILQNV